MTQTARLLDLLGLLQTGRPWPGSQLATRLEVTPRTVRRDVERLRDMGYPIEGAMGAQGGYRLVAGTAMPPLLLDDDEAVAVAIALRTVASAGVPGVEDAGLSALGKLRQSLPSRLAARVGALSSLSIGWDPDRPAADAEVLGVLASAATRRERLRMDYERRDGETSRRHVEPLRLVLQHRRWYLLAIDLDRGAGRVFRVDRISAPHPTGVPAVHALPEEEVADLMRRRALAAEPVLRADVTLRLPLAVAAERLRDELGRGSLDAEGDETRWRSDEDTVHWLAMRLLRLDCDFVVHGPPALVERLQAIHRRTAR
ncbi:helix-turn-helix transcriptional regulator [Microbacterium sp. NPDC057659]|uniref:helix-turn-helix transcriptional regulator n=1 Tax=Microbacterium sp. NPDC057659 TaxID=3346198 RepID=UPI00366AA9EC